MVFKEYIRLSIDSIGILKQYFLRGHMAWFSLMFNITNFTLIFYYFFLSELDFLPAFLKTFPVFFATFLIIYIPIASILGYLDIRKGTFYAENIMYENLHPLWKKLYDRIDELEQKIDLIRLAVTPLIAKQLFDVEKSKDAYISQSTFKTTQYDDSFASDDEKPIQIKMREPTDVIIFETEKPNPDRMDFKTMKQQIRENEEDSDE